MKICWITSSYIKNIYDSTSPFLHEIAKHLAASGVEVHVITPMSADSIDEEVIDGVVIHRFSFLPQKYDKLTYGGGMAVNLKKYSIAKFQLIPYTISCMYSFYKLHRQENFNLIHAHWAFPAGFIATILKYIYSIPLITTLHGTEVFLSDKYKLAKYLMKYCLNYSDSVITNSTYTMQCSKELIDREYAVIPMGIDTTKYFPLSTTNIAELKEKLGLPDKRVLITVCRLIERKGVNYILDSLNYIKTQNICLIIVGNGPEKEKLIEYANELTSKNAVLQIIFKEQVSEAELIELHQICDIELLTSIIDDTGETEGLGVVLIEGGACGKPLIGSNVGGISDVIVDEYNGYLVEQKDAKMLAEKIEGLLENDDIRKDMGNKSRTHVVKKFDISNVVNKHISIYNEKMQESI